MYLPSGLYSIGRRVDDLGATATAVPADENLWVVAHKRCSVHAKAERFRQVVARCLAQCAENGVAFDHMSAVRHFTKFPLTVRPGCSDFAAHAFEASDPVAAAHRLRHRMEPELAS